MKAFGAYVIGDEILVGKRQDKHLAFLIGALASRGLRLAWCEYLGDDPQRLTGELRRRFAGDAIVFSFGGIGATPDDHTRACAAAAAGVDLVLHPEAEAEIRGRFGADTTPNRLKMGEFPRGASTIPNDYNRIRGFSLGEHHFVPGFPVMAWPMVEWVLDQRYAHLFHRQVEAEASITVYDSAESTLTPLMEAVEANYPGLKVFSLPSVGEEGRRRHIELGVRGSPEEVPGALEELKRGVSETGGKWEAHGGPPALESAG